jgi:hypothetical protein
VAAALRQWAGSAAADNTGGGGASWADSDAAAAALDAAAAAACNAASAALSGSAARGGNTPSPRACRRYSLCRAYDDTFSSTSVLVVMRRFISSARYAMVARLRSTHRATLAWMCLGHWAAASDAGIRNGSLAGTLMGTARTRLSAIRRRMYASAAPDAAATDSGAVPAEKYRSRRMLGARHLVGKSRLAQLMTQNPPFSS